MEGVGLFGLVFAGTSANGDSAVRPRQLDATRNGEWRPGDTGGSDQPRVPRAGVGHEAPEDTMGPHGYKTQYQP